VCRVVLCCAACAHRRELFADAADWKEREGNLLTITSLLRSAPALLSGAELDAAIKLATGRLKDENANARTASVTVLGQALRNATARDEKSGVDGLLTTMLALVPEQKANIETVRLGALGELQQWAEPKDVHSRHVEPRMHLLVERLLPWIADMSLDVKRAVHQTIYFVLGYHIAHDKAEALLTAAIEQLNRKDDTEGTEALTALAKKTLSRLEVSRRQMDGTAEAEEAGAGAGADADEKGAGSGAALDSKSADRSVAGRAGPPGGPSSAAASSAGRPAGAGDRSSGGGDSDDGGDEDDDEGDDLGILDDDD
jgi:hypothetical protein